MVEAATDPERLLPLDAEHRGVVAQREAAEHEWLELTT
jgi:ATP-binding cassette subfamily F protein uup